MIESLRYELAIPAALRFYEQYLQKAEDLSRFDPLRVKDEILRALLLADENVQKARALKPTFPLETGLQPYWIIDSQQTHATLVDELTIHVSPTDCHAIQYFSEYQRQWANLGVLPHLDTWQHKIAGIREVRMTRGSEQESWEERDDNRPFYNRQSLDHQWQRVGTLYKWTQQAREVRDYLEAERAHKIGIFQCRSGQLIDRYGVSASDLESLPIPQAA